MNDIRARFEEIWPVPECIEWLPKWSEYVSTESTILSEMTAGQFNARLDTFTRCQDMFVASLPERMEMQPYQTVDRGSTNYKAGFNACLKQIMEQKK